MERRRLQNALLAHLLPLPFRVYQDRRTHKCTCLVLQCLALKGSIPRPNRPSCNNLQCNQPRLFLLPSKVRLLYRSTCRLLQRARAKHSKASLSLLHCSLPLLLRKVHLQYRNSRYLVLRRAWLANNNSHHSHRQTLHSYSTTSRRW
jgi:hypothetical protein